MKDFRHVMYQVTGLPIGICFCHGCGYDFSGILWKNSQEYGGKGVVPL